MRPSAAPPISPAPADEFAGDVEYYLGLEPRQLPSRYLYDPLGSALFNAICELPWYRVTQAELNLLARHGRDILDQASPVSRIVELGPGNGSKLQTLLETRRAAGRKPLELHLIDISGKALDESGQVLAALDGADALTIVTHETTYENGLTEVMQEARPAGRTLVLFLGSNIGNFDRPDAASFLRSIRTALRPDDGLLISADLVKPEADLLLAYDDPLGVTAAFDRNLLVRINRELGGDFDLEAFGHRAVWNAEESRVEMHLVSRRRQRVRIPLAHTEITLEEGDTIWTESSYKYDLDSLAALFEGTGLQPVERWVADERFALMLVRAV